MAEIATLEEGTVFADRYRLGPLIGSGGFSRVYSAIQLGVERRVAIKVLHPSMTGTAAPPDMVEKRFLREAKLISQLRDPHTIVMHEYGQQEELLFMVFEYIDGTDLTHVLNATGAISASRARNILVQILTALEEAHALGILHRDIKPSNVMLYSHMSRRDCVKLLDFGVAKTVAEEAQYDANLTADGMLVGTPRYMSPEQITLQELTAASDLYSVGLVCLELLTGRRAFDGLNMTEMRRFKVSKDVVVPSGLPSDLQKVLSKLLRHDPSKRFQSASEVLQVLRKMKPASNPNDQTSSIVMFPLDMDISGVAPVTEITAITKTTPAEEFEPKPPPTATETASESASAKPRTGLVVLAIVLIAVVVAILLKTFFDPGDVPEPEPEPPEVKVEKKVETSVEIPKVDVELVQAIGFAMATRSQALTQSDVAQKSSAKKATEKRDRPKPKVRPKKNVDVDSKSESEREREREREGV